MTKLQIAALASAAGLFLFLYFACETKPPSQKALEKSRALMIESTDINSLLAEAKNRLAPDKLRNILALEADLEQAAGESRIQWYKTLSGEWFALKEPALAGYYAQEAADREESAEAWGIAGTTYALCAKEAKTDKEKDFCLSRAIKALESAISLAPEELSHRINLALVNVDFPPADNAMKGILMLRELEGQHPDSPAVLFHLGRLAVQTGQWDRAIARLERVLELDPGNQNASLLLIQAYQETGAEEKAARILKQLN
jgi:tetratricopeptide (TPR) repeat protein